MAARFRDAEPDARSVVRAADAAAEGGALTDGPPGASVRRVIGGPVLILSDDTFSHATPLDASGVIGFEAAGVREVSWFHGPSYVLAVQGTPGATWIDATVTDGASDAIATLQLVDLGSSGRWLRLARRDVLATVLGQLTPPQVLDPSRAQIVLSFVDAAGVPAAGLTVVPEPGMAVAYDQGSAYSNSTAATGPRGIALIVNQVAEPFPGGFAAVSFRRRLGSFAGAVRLRTAQASVTLTTIIAPG